MGTFYHSLLILLFLVSSLSIQAQGLKVGLALGGGGAKGAATIGVLKVIERAGIKADYIAGTSIGAIIGGLYSVGYSISELETLFLSQEWQDVLEGHRVESKLKLLFENRGAKTFRDTRIPFKCVAAENGSFKEVVLSSGSLYKAIRASMSIPIVYEPVKWGDKYLVDGGLINNLPVDVVRAMGADIVIAIDLQQNGEFGIGITTGTGGLVDWFLTRPDIERRRKNILDADLHIHPILPDFTTVSFGHDNCELMIQMGEERGEWHWDELLEIRNSQR